MKSIIIFSHFTKTFFKQTDFKQNDIMKWQNEII